LIWDAEVTEAAREKRAGRRKGSARNKKVSHSILRVGRPKHIKWLRSRKPRKDRRLSSNRSFKNKISNVATKVNEKVK
jgi:hypothetical protein